MYQLVPPKQRELRTKITVHEPGNNREGGSLKDGNKLSMPLKQTTWELFSNLLLTIKGDNDQVTRRVSAANTCIVTDLYFYIWGHQIKVRGGLGKGEGVTREVCVWVGAPVPPLPQPPIEEHGKGSWPSLFINNTGSRYSCGTGPACGRLKRGRKEQHAGPALSDSWPREKGGLNQITLVIWLTSFSLPSGTGKGVKMKEGEGK